MQRSIFTPPGSSSCFREVGTLYLSHSLWYVIDESRHERFRVPIFVCIWYSLYTDECQCWYFAVLLVSHLITAVYRSSLFLIILSQWLLLWELSFILRHKDQSTYMYYVYRVIRLCDHGIGEV